MQDYTSNNKIKENKYKILRMSLLLGSDDNREETLNNFEDAAYEIDAMNDEIYLKDLEKKFYDTSTLEEEEKKLASLVDYIGGRVEQRISLLSDFSNVTGFDLKSLPPIKYYDKLDDYKERLSYIREYLENTDRLNTLNKEVTDANIKLEKAYKNKAISEEYNQRNEEVLLNKFETIFKSLDYFKNVTEENLEEELTKILSSVEESKKSLDIFTKSFTTLTNSGISKEEEDEYHSYVVNAQQVYYSNKEKEYILELYKYLLKKEDEYSAILLKRDNINNLLYERLNIRETLGISDNDCLLSLYDMLERQYEDINRQKDNMEMIDSLNEYIESKKTEINELETDNQKVEILAILREYGIIETYSEPVKEETTELEEIPTAENNIFDFKINNNETEELPEITKTPEIFLQEEPTEEPTEETTYTKDLETPEERAKEEVEINNDIFNTNNEIQEENENIVNEEAEEVSEIETPEPNQVIKVEQSEHIDLDLVHSKANKVMQRVGEMLGIRPKEEELVTVTNEQPVIEPTKEEVKEEPTNEIPIAEPINPLFSNTNIEPIKEETKEPELDDNSFWFPSDTPDALNELPDLEVEKKEDDNNFFSNNNMPELNFPDLNLDFKNNEEA